MRRTGRLLFLLVAVSSFLLHSGSYAQSAGGDNNRKKAFELFKQDKRRRAVQSHHMAGAASLGNHQQAATEARPRGYSE